MPEAKEHHSWEKVFEFLAKGNLLSVLLPFIVKSYKFWDAKRLYAYKIVTIFL